MKRRRSRLAWHHTREIPPPVPVPPMPPAAPKYALVAAGGRVYNPDDPNLLFAHWLEYFVATAKETSTLTDFLYSDTIARLLRPTDVEWLSKSLTLTDFDDYSDFAFLTGDYSGSDKKSRLCRQFRKLQIEGNSSQLVGVFEQIEKMCRVIRLYDRVLPNITVKGEPGTGKESLAKAIHELSGRGKAGGNAALGESSPFHSANCAGIVSTLAESELFGHVKGAFTGADRDRVGLIEQCEGGTLQLDEFEKMETQVQFKLLRALQEKQITPVGSNEVKNIDILFVACVNEFPQNEAVLGRVTGDCIEVPPLRDRIGDIPVLLNHFLIHDYQASPLDDIRFSLAVEFMHGANYLFPSNVRSLQSVIRERLGGSLGEDFCPEEEALLRAYSEASREENRTTVSQAALGRALEWNGTKDCDRRVLQNEPWRGLIDKLIQKGKVNPRRS